jgi:hypothetical protein
MKNDTHQKARVFEETYHDYLFRLQQVNLMDRAEKLGASVVGNELSLPFFNSEFLVSAEGIRSRKQEKVPFAVKVVLSRYILMCPANDELSDAHLVSYREFKDAAPLISYFTTNTTKTIEIAHSGDLENLHDKCTQAGGVEQKHAGYDLSMMFNALPKIPMYLNFNDADDEFPAKCVILYKSDAEKYLDMECLAITGTYLVGKLL